MDPRLLLGVSVRAGRSEVRAAHRRLRRAVDPARGGTVELVRLVDDAAATLAGSPSSTAPTRPPEPHAVLGLAATDRPTPAQVQATYRRLARLVHPDHGGTDELFRVVAAARDELLAPSPRRPAGRGGAAPPSPPARPAPRGPYRAPPPGERHVVPTARAVRELANHGAVLVAAGVLVVTAFEIGRWTGVLAVAAVLVAGGPVLRPAVEGVARSVIVLLGSRVRVPEAVAPERFLEATCLDTPVGRQPEQELYAAYVRWCGHSGRGAPVASWVFIERLRTLGLLLVKSSSLEQGLWVGITLRRAP